MEEGDALDWIKQRMEKKEDKALCDIENNDPRVTHFFTNKSENISILARALKSNSHLNSLIMNKKATQSDLLCFVQIITTNFSITKLCIDHNEIGSDGAKLISQALLTNFTITNLDLSMNRIGDEGAFYISQALSTNSTLTKLSLNSNSIRHIGAEHLSQALSVNSTLTTLDLFLNPIKNLGAESILKLFETNSTLLNMDIFHCGISKELESSISTNTERNTHNKLIRAKTLQQLCCNSFTFEHVDILVEQFPSYLEIYFDI